MPAASAKPAIALLLVALAANGRCGAVAAAADRPPRACSIAPLQAVRQVAAGLADRLRRSWQFHNLLGQIDLRCGRPDDAGRRFATVSQLAPDKAAGHVGLGLAAARLAQFDQARQSFEQALRLEPDNVDAAYGLAVSFTRQGKFHQAEPLYRRVLSLCPRHTLAAHNLATIALQFGRLAEAQRLWEQVLADAPDLPTARYNLGQVYFLLRAYDEAVATLSPLAAKPARDADALNILGLACQAKADHGQALKWLQLAYQTAPTDPVIMNNLAALHAALYALNPDKPDHLRQAVRLWTASLACQPDQPGLADLIRVYSARLDSIAQ